MSLGEKWNNDVWPHSCYEDVEEETKRFAGEDGMTSALETAADEHETEVSQNLICS